MTYDSISPRGCYIPTGQVRITYLFHYANGSGRDADSLKRPVVVVMISCDARPHTRDPPGDEISLSRSNYALGLPASQSVFVVSRRSLPVLSFMVSETKLLVVTGFSVGPGCYLPLSLSLFRLKGLSKPWRRQTSTDKVTA